MSTHASDKPERVYLVGAGPGDPDLLTIKALRILRAADVVLHDELVSPEILKLARSDALIRNVGRRCGVRNVCQQTINALMVGYALAGLAVVRLKGGDPMIFGRADEEIAALRSAGIQVEIVPGITAALGAASAARAPLTHRYMSSVLVITTYRRAANQQPIDWRAMIANRATIVLYMPGADYRSIAEELGDAGLSGATPCVIASQVTTSREVLVTTTLDRLREASPLPPPAILIIGPVSLSSSLGSAELNPAELLNETPLAAEI